MDTSEEQKAQVAWLRKPGRAKSPTVQVVAHTSKTQVQPYWTTKLRFGDSGGKPVLRALHVAASGSVCSTLAGRRLASVVGRARRLVRSRAVGKAVPHCSPGALGSFGHIKSRVCDIRLADNLELIRAVLGCLRNRRSRDGQVSGNSRDVRSALRIRACTVQGSRSSCGRRVC